MKNDLLLLSSPKYEKAMDAIRTMVARHHSLYYPGVLCTVILTFLFYIAMLFYGNRRRLSALALLLLFFVAGSSFALPVQTDAVDSAVPGADRLARSVTEEVRETADITLYPISSGAEGEVAGMIWEEASPGAPIEGRDSFMADDWRLILLNKQHPIPDDYVFPIGNINDEQQCDERIIPELKEMFTAAAADGVYLVFASPYRTHSRQEMLFDTRVSELMEGGMSFSEAYSTASQTIMIPGSSEHQVGLAIDITTGTYDRLDVGFADTDGGKWLAAHCHEYGFILRYPKDREEITGVGFEPWHFRYVGKEAAGIIMENDLTLEEFWTQYIYR